MFVVASVVFFALFLLSVVRDPRRFSSAILLGFGFTCLGLDLLGAVVEGRSPAWLEVTFSVFAVLLGLVVLALPVALIANGVQMLRREGRRMANLLSLLAGFGILGCDLLFVTLLRTGSAVEIAIASVVLPVVGYVSFLFLCFLGYAFLYGRLPVRRDADFLVVLGSGLLGGSRVPPLLAARLDRGRAVYERQADLGKAPVMITSGGQGPDEDLPEAWAMADYLVERGVLTDRIEREDRSRTTEENLRFSHAIMKEREPGYRCLIVTNNFHVFRVATIARRTGVNGQVIGAPTAAYFWPSATIREFVAVFLNHKVVNLGLCLLLGLVGLAAVYR